MLYFSSLLLAKISKVGSCAAVAYQQILSFFIHVTPEIFFTKN